MPNFDPNCSRYRWLSVIDGDYESYGWHAVDFETQNAAKYDIEQWWSHMCRGEAFRP